MARIHPARRALGATVIVAVAATLAPAAGAAAPESAAQALATKAWPGIEPCPDVVILSVRGSNEVPQPDDGGDPLDPDTYNADTAWGMGHPGSLTAGEVQGAANGDGVTSVRQGAIYPALPVPDKVAEFDPYIDSIEAGADAVVKAVSHRLNAACPGVPTFEIIGYSQGAWSVRIAVRRLAAKFGDPEAHGMPFIGGVTLLGDPTFDSDESIVRWDPKEDRRDLGVAHVKGLRHLVPDHWYAPYSWMVRSRVSSYCLGDDLICRAPRRWSDFGLRLLALKLPGNLDGHLSYGSETVVRAGAWLARFLPSSSLAARTFAQSVLNDAQAGDLASLWDVWADDYSSPQALVTAMNGQPGHVEGCYLFTVDYSHCQSRLDASPDSRWFMTVVDAGGGDLVVNYSSPS